MNAAIKSYRDLIAWQKARGLVKAIYEATSSFPAAEVYGLNNQMRRAAVSIPSNIAEGYGRGSRKEYARFLQVSRGSLCELETQIVVANDLGYLDAAKTQRLTDLTDECSRLIYGLLKALQMNTISRKT